MPFPHIQGLVRWCPVCQVAISNPSLLDPSLCPEGKLVLHLYGFGAPRWETQNVFGWLNAGLRPVAGHNLNHALRKIVMAWNAMKCHVWWHLMTFAGFVSLTHLNHFPSLEMRRAGNEPFDIWKDLKARLVHLSNLNTRWIENQVFHA